MLFSEIKKTFTTKSKNTIKTADTKQKQNKSAGFTNMNNFKKSLLMAEIVQIKRIDLSKNE